MSKITPAAARVANKLTQEQMADKLGVSRILIWQLENGKTEFKPLYLYAYSAVTGFSTDDFILPERTT